MIAIIAVIAMQIVLELPEVGLNFINTATFEPIFLWWEKFSSGFGCIHNHFGRCIYNSKQTVYFSDLRTDSHGLDRRVIACLKP